MKLGVHSRKVILKYLTRLLVSRDFENVGDLLELYARLNDQVMTGELLRYARNNGVAHIFYEALAERGLERSELARALAKDAEAVYRNAQYRDELLRLLVDVLEEGGIEYVVFKTFNQLGIVDVDVDIIVQREAYWDTVKRLISKGFKPVDDLEKTYATGFVIKGNPLIVDLHTEVTILGIPYVNSETLFKHKARVKYRSNCCGSIDLYVLDSPAEALTRIAHSVIKEAEIKIDDISEVLKVAKEQPSELAKLLKVEELDPALFFFAEKVDRELCLGIRKPESFDSRRGLRVLRGIVSRGKDVPPYHLPRLVSVAVLIHRVRRRSEVGLLLRVLENLRYRRNAAHIGSLLVRRII